MSVDSPGFHAHSGWYFHRDPDPDGDGQVHIIAPDSAGPGAQQVAWFDADTWASNVAHVSAGGDTAATVQAARRMHSGDPGR